MPELTDRARERLLAIQSDPQLLETEIVRLHDLTVGLTREDFKVLQGLCYIAHELLESYILPGTQEQVMALLQALPFLSNAFRAKTPLSNLIGRIFMPKKCRNNRGRDWLREIKDHDEVSGVKIRTAYDNRGDLVSKN
jgi:hypothetical protein